MSFNKDLNDRDVEPFLWSCSVLEAVELISGGHIDFFYLLLLLGPLWELLV